MQPFLAVVAVLGLGLGLGAPAARAQGNAVHALVKTAIDKHLSVPNAGWAGKVPSAGYRVKLYSPGNHGADRLHLVSFQATKTRAGSPELQAVGIKALRHELHGTVDLRNGTVDVSGGSRGPVFAAMKAR